MPRSNSGRHRPNARSPSLSCRFKMAAKAARSPATLVLVELLYARWKAKSSTFPLPNSGLKALGASRDVKRRVLRDLERQQVILVKRSARKTPIITVIGL